MLTPLDENEPIYIQTEGFDDWFTEEGELRDDLNPLTRAAMEHALEASKYDIWILYAPRSTPSPFE